MSTAERETDTSGRLRPEVLRPEPPASPALDPAPALRTASDVLADCREIVEPALRAAVGSLPEPMRRIVGYHFGWLDESGAAVEGSTGAGGKALRPALALLCSAVVGGAGLSGQTRRAGLSAQNRQIGVPAAVAVELVHNFSLLHDDVMDGDPTRRHRPTTWTVFGVGPAILAGDALLTLAMDVLIDSGHSAAGAAVRMLGGSVQELVEGQIADLAFEQRTDVTVAECLAMAAAKTGSLLGTSCALGAVFGGARPAQTAELSRFGRELGLAFQCVDDLLGIWGDPVRTGKPIGNDLRHRKKSLPVVAALSSGTAAGRELARIYTSRSGAGELVDGDVALAAELIHVAGGRAWCQDQADRLLRTAQGRLLDPGFELGVVGDLRLLAALMADRTS